METTLQERVWIIRHDAAGVYYADDHKSCPKQCLFKEATAKAMVDELQSFPETRGCYAVQVTGEDIGDMGWKPFVFPS